MITGAGLLGVTPAQALEAYGHYFVGYVNKQGHEKLMQCLGSTLVTFLMALNDLHLHLSTSLTHMDAPAFRCINVTSTSCELHYYSNRPALWPIVKGIVEEVATSMYGHPATMTLIASREPEEGMAASDHEVFRVTFPEQPSLADREQDEAQCLQRCAFPLSARQFAEMHPFHLIVDQHLVILQTGPTLARMYPATMRIGAHLSESFTIRHPHVPMDYTAMVTERDSTFLFIGRSAGLQLKAELILVRHPSCPDADAMLILGSPRLVNLEDLQKHRLYLSDIPLHNMARDYVLMLEHLHANFSLKNRFEATAVELARTNTQLVELSDQLRKEQERSQALVYQMLPQAVANRLLKGESVEAIAYEELTLLFSDIVGFTPMCQQCTPHQVSQILNDLYSRFDTLCELPAFDGKVYKMETIGDAYMLVCNLEQPCGDHADVCLAFAKAMHEQAAQVMGPGDVPLRLRVGVHTGPAVGGIVGRQRPRFCLFGQTVNTASRMESHGLPGMIQISGATFDRLERPQEAGCHYRGMIDIKGMGPVETYLVQGRDSPECRAMLEKELEEARKKAGGPLTRTSSTTQISRVASVGKMVELSLAPAESP